MFFRKLGQQVLLLHSYRDGYQNVRQRRLTHIPMSEVPTLVQNQQHWNAWKKGVQGLYPELSCQWDRLLCQLEKFVEQVPSGRVRLPKAQPSESPTRQIFRLSKALLEQLDKLEADRCESVNPVLQELKGKLSQLGLSDGTALSQQLRRLRRHLPTRRKCVDQSCPEAQSLIQELSSLAQERQREGHWPECAEVWGEGVKMCPEWLEARLQYGSALLVLGRRQEALQQFGQLPRQDARRHFHSALAWWSEGRLDECVQSIVLGMTYGRGITQAILVNLISGRRVL